MSYRIDHCDDHVHVDLREARKVLSSAVLNGGWQEADHIVNIKVPKNRDGRHGHCHPPQVTLRRYITELGLSGKCVGMMTGASMRTFREVVRKEGDVLIAAAVTTGFSNAGRAGDLAQWRQFDDDVSDTGTINIIILTNAKLSAAAMVEAVITATEAKTVALGNLGVKSCASGLPATGTGTDAIAVVSGSGPREVIYCGKHVLFGEMLADTVIRAVTESAKS